MGKYKVQVDYGDEGFNGTYSLLNAMWVIRKYAKQAKVTVSHPQKDKGK